MSLDPCQPCIPPPRRIPQRVVGSAITLPFKLVDRVTRRGIDISSATEIVAVFLNADNTFWESKLTMSNIILTDPTNGAFNVFVPQADSALLKPSIPGNWSTTPPTPPVYSSVELHFTIASVETIVNAPNCVNLVPRLFPTAP